MTRRSVRLAAVIATCLALVACSIPHTRDDASVSKLAIDPDDVDAVYDRYREIYNVAVDIDASQPLSVVESGAVLAIDTAAFLVEGATRPTALEAEQVAIPRFDSYPLWFVAIAGDADSDERRVQVFARSGAIDTWQLVASPDIVAGADLPELRTSADATAVTVKPDDARGMPASAEEIVTTYVEALSSLPEGAAEGLSPDDPFLTQMRESFDQGQALPGVQFSQTWSADPVEHVLRTADGGALVFATLYRTDAYQIDAGSTLTWPEGTPQAALAPTGLTGGGAAQFAHQILVRVPPGSGTPQVIGHFGGLTAIE